MTAAAIGALVLMGVVVANETNRLQKELAGLRGELKRSQDGLAAAQHDTMNVRNQLAQAVRDRESVQTQLTALQNRTRPPQPRSFQLCNKATTGKLFAAVAYQTATGWKALGWFGLERGSCERFGGVVGDRVMYFANDPTWRQWSGDVATCVHPTDRFEMPYRDSCGAPFEVRQFISRPLTVDGLTFNLID